MIQKSVAALGVFVLLGATLVGCGSNEKKQALEQEKIQQEKDQQEEIRQEKIRQERYCAAVHDFDDLYRNGSNTLPPGISTIENLALQMYNSAPAEDQKKLKPSVDVLIVWADASKRAANQDSFLASLAGVTGLAALEVSSDYPAGRALAELRDYASMHRCDTFYVR